MPFKAVFDKRMTHGALQALAALCTYCNRAGITWVSQKRIASDLQISQQAVAKQFKQLRECGYLETIRKGFKGARSDTQRVIFDPTVDAETAMAVTSSMEDTRPPVIIKEQQAAADKADLEGQRRVAQAISKALKQPAKRGPIVVKSTDTMTVRNIKSAMKKAQSSQSKAVHKPVDNSIHKQPLIQPPGCTSNNPQVVHNSEEISISQVTSRQVVKETLLTSLNSSNLNSSNLTSVLNNQEFAELVQNGIKPSQIVDSLSVLLPLYQAEGITPTSKALMDGIRQLQADAR
jgi:DNA-binding transcriptional regulator YhcF (GntR family)